MRAVNRAIIYVGEVGRKRFQLEQGCGMRACWASLKTADLAASEVAHFWGVRDVSRVSGPNAQLNVCHIDWLLLIQIGELKG